MLRLQLIGTASSRRNSATNRDAQELGGPITSAKLNAVTNAAIAVCDGDDGVVDDVINDPRKCKYDPAESICQPGSDPATCLTPAEANAVRKIWDGPVSVTSGQPLWFGLERGASLLGLAGTSPFPIATTHFQYWIHQDPTFDWRTLSEADFETDFRESQRKFNQVIGTDASSFRFSKPAANDHLAGEADQWIFPLHSQLLQPCAYQVRPPP